MALAFLLLFFASAFANLFVDTKPDAAVAAAVSFLAGRPRSLGTGAVEAPRLVTPVVAIRGDGGADGATKPLVRVVMWGGGDFFGAGGSGASSSV